MLLAAEPIIRLVVAYPSVKMVALTLLLLIGSILILEGLGAGIPKWIIYLIVAALVFYAGNDVRNRKRIVVEHKLDQRNSGMGSIRNAEANGSAAKPEMTAVPSRVVEGRTAPVRTSVIWLSVRISMSGNSTVSPASSRPTMT